MQLSIDQKDIDKFIMIGDKVLIKPKNPQSQTKSGLYLPPTVQQEKIQSGYIIKVGRFQFPQSAGDTGNAALKIFRQPCQRIEHICPALHIHPAVLLRKGHTVQQQNIRQSRRMGKAHLQQKFRIKEIRRQWGLCFDVLFTQTSS